MIKLIKEEGNLLTFRFVDTAKTLDFADLRSILVMKWDLGGQTFDMLEFDKTEFEVNKDYTYSF